MSSATKIVGLMTVWALAAVVLFAVGMNVGKTNRWDGCDLAYYEAELVRICHTGARVTDTPLDIPTYERKPS